MRGLLAVGAAVAAVLLLAAPATTVTAEPSTPHLRPHVLPDVPDRRGEGCTLPVGSSLARCPLDGRSRPPVSCVLPVDLPPGTTLVVPECAPREPAPEGRVVPVLLFTR